MVKKNQIAACGGIAQAISSPTRLHEELRWSWKAWRNCEALDAGADIAMLDELSLKDVREAVWLTAGRANLEASGGINDNTLCAIEETGVDYIWTSNVSLCVYRYYYHRTHLMTRIALIKLKPLK